MCNSYTKIKLMIVASTILLSRGGCGVISGAEVTSDALDPSFIKWAEELTFKTSKQMRSEMERENNQKIQERKCSMQNISEVEQELPGFPRLMGFISFSMPIETLLELSLQLQRVGGAFVIRGLPGNSFKLLSEKILELRERGSNIPILIDPKAFETHNVEHVPTFVLFDGNKFDKIAGNISIEHVLSRFAEKGELKGSKNLLDLYRGR